jgi:hypothetical protein
MNALKLLIRTRQSGPAAHEVDNLQAVAFMEFGRGPAIARHNIAVQLDGDTVGPHAESFHQASECEWGLRIGEVALVSVDVEFHLELILLPPRDYDMNGILLGFAQQEFSGSRASFKIGLHKQR